MNGQNDRESSIKRLYSFLLADQVLHNGEPIDIPFVEFDSIECKGVFIVALVLEENFKPIYNERGEAHAHVIMDYANANRLTHVVTTNFPIRRHARLTKSLGNVHFFARPRSGGRIPARPSSCRTTRRRSTCSTCSRYGRSKSTSTLTRALPLGCCSPRFS